MPTASQLDCTGRRVVGPNKAHSYGARSRSAMSSAWSVPAARASS